MSEAERLFKQTEIERKKLGYGDKHKKRGGGRYVRLPSDNLTKKEREALNGEIKTWKQKPFYTREEFKNLPDDVQIQWVNSIINRYDAGMSSICRSVFKCNQTWLNNHFAGKGATEYINKASGGRAGEKGREKLEAAFTEWLNSGQPTLTEDNDGQRTLSTDTDRSQATASDRNRADVETQVEPSKNLKETQQKAIRALLNCHTIEDAAKTSGVGYSTLRFWLKEDAEFKAAFSDAQRKLNEDALEKAKVKTPTEVIKPDCNLDYQNIALLLQSLVGTGAKLTIEVTL